MESREIEILAFYRNCVEFSSKSASMRPNQENMESGGMIRIKPKPSAEGHHREQLPMPNQMPDPLTKPGPEDHILIASENLVVRR